MVKTESKGAIVVVVDVCGTIQSSKWRVVNETPQVANNLRRRVERWNGVVSNAGEKKEKKVCSYTHGTDKDCSNPRRMERC